MIKKITPALWFHTEDGKLGEVTSYYKSVFGSNFEAEAPVSLGETPSGYAEMANVRLFGDDYLFMTTAIEHHRFNDTFAIMIHCRDQQEIDHYWNYFTREGNESMCGWCMDKFGLRWQIIPENLAELMSKPNANAVLSRQRKIIIAEF
jgi:predicted 3-demethylubiquinone-9 3-methyltransferase (glyoxalase superfamily)